MAQNLQLINTDSFKCKIGRAWKWIPGYEGLYNIDENANVYRVPSYRKTKNGIAFCNGGQLKPKGTQNRYKGKLYNKRYLYYELWKDGNAKSFYPHRILPELFNK